ncbi:MAG TPA: nucleotidyltransferase domain-containing protein [candidate division WOR-3 bacterium]|uniref:Nucleotidyltransferase domain-containing protein n=1 Tax=candidate division WOR-3 bacterium TaxID=2052148 RepID=A0A7C5DBD3_UNCW3|nr:nucleotidyltransferase domain-containing protein [candidate division WOR-3 bacterium]
MDIDSKREQILKIIFKYLPRDEILVFLFGSFAKEEVYNSSDIDVGIISQRKIDPNIILRLKEELNEEVSTLRDIDLVDFTEAKDRQFLNNALREVKIWWKNEKLLSYLENLRRP